MEPSTDELAGILEVAVAAARDAGEVLLEHLGHLREDQVGSKSAARDLVTAADVASERLLTTRLREAFPDHAIEAEEETRDAPGGPGELRWLIDPLDGTNNFVHQLPCFAVSMGLYRGGEPLVGVVHLPRLGETFTATAGGGAFLDGRAIRVSRATGLSEAILATGFPYRRGELEHDNLANFGRFFYDVRGLRRMGSAAIDLAYTAAGRFDGFWELHLTPYDVAGGALLVLEAGGVVTDADGGQDWLRSGHIVAAGPGLHGTVRERVLH